MSPTDPSLKPPNLNRTVRFLVRKIKPGIPKEAPMPGELDSTEEQLARFFGRAGARGNAGAVSSPEVDDSSSWNSTGSGMMASDGGREGALDVATAAVKGRLRDEEGMLL